MGYVIVIYCSFSDYFVCTFSNIFLWLKLTLSKYVQTQNGLIFLAVTLHYITRKYFPCPVRHFIRILLKFCLTYFCVFVNFGLPTRSNIKIQWVWTMLGWMTQVCKDGLMLIISSQDIPFHLLFATCWDIFFFFKSFWRLSSWFLCLRGHCRWQYNIITVSESLILCWSLSVSTGGMVPPQRSHSGLE